MRIAVISDIHGNFQALEAVLLDIARQNVDEIISLGDNIGYGPQPEEVIRQLIESNIFSVMGNHELALISASYYSRLNQTAQTSLCITKKLISTPSLAWVTSLHPATVRYGARFVHGCPPLSITSYLFNPSETKLYRIFHNFIELLDFSGHTHTMDCFIYQESDIFIRHRLAFEPLQLSAGYRYIIIPGSVGQPRDRYNNKAKYGIWDQENQTFLMRQVSYDTDKTISLLTRRGFPVSNALRLKQ